MRELCAVGRAGQTLGDHILNANGRLCFPGKRGPGVRYEWGAPRCGEGTWPRWHEHCDTHVVRVFVSACGVCFCRLQRTQRCIPRVASASSGAGRHHVVSRRCGGGSAGARFWNLTEPGTVTLTMGVQRHVRLANAVGLPGTDESGTGGQLRAAEEVPSPDVDNVVPYRNRTMRHRHHGCRPAAASLALGGSHHQRRVIALWRGSHRVPREVYT